MGLYFSGKLLKAFDKQLSAHHLSIKEDILINASTVDGLHRLDGALWVTVTDDWEDACSENEKEEEEAYHRSFLQERKGTGAKPDG